MLRIKQISAVQDQQTNDVLLYAVDAEGRVWLYDGDYVGWKALTMEEAPVTA